MCGRSRGGEGRTVLVVAEMPEARSTCCQKKALWTIKYIRACEIDPSEIELRQTPTVVWPSCFSPLLAVVKWELLGMSLKAMGFTVLIKSF